MSKLVWGILSTANIGIKRVIPAILAGKRGVIAAIASRDAARARSVAERFGIARSYGSYEALLADPEIEAIYNPLPNHLHVEWTVRALEAGKHVLCEKPVAIDADDARRMLDAADSAGVAHAICFENRFDPVRLALRDEVMAGVLGTPYFARAHTSADYWHPTRGLQSEWMYKVREGGGYLMGMSSHDIDFVCELFGEPEEVCGDVRTTIAQRDRGDGTTLEVDADDTSVVLMRMRNGMLVTVSSSAVALGANDRELELAGSHARIVVRGGVQEGGLTVRMQRVGEDGATDVALAAREIRSGYELPKRRAAGAIRSLALMLEDWLPAFSGRPTPGVPTLRDGLRVQAVIDAVRRSSEGAGWVPVGGN
jgi:predicted dehydrogenase